MKIEELIEKRLLRRISIDKNKVIKSIKTAEKFLKQAKDMKNKVSEEYVIIASYSAMFHASRAILYSEGIQEKSHFAVIQYLQEKHEKEMKTLISKMNIAREQRHEGLYGIETEFEEEELEHNINVANEIIIKAKKITKINSEKNEITSASEKSLAKEWNSKKRRKSMEKFVKK